LARLASCARISATLALATSRFLLAFDTCSVPPCRDPCLRAAGSHDRRPQHEPIGQ
jgi:hypothetical protein